MSDTTPTFRIVSRYPRDRECEKCHSIELALLDLGGGYWRKECLNCGSTGPFIPRTLQGHMGAARV